MQFYLLGFETGGEYTLVDNFSETLAIDSFFDDQTALDNLKGILWMKWKTIRF